MAAAAAEAAETGARAGGRSHPEAEMLAAAGGSEGTPVNLCVTNVYNSSSSEISSLETTNTIADLKRLLQEAIPSRPAPHQQRLIFRGKQCEETQQLGHVLRGLDLSGQHNIHLIVSPSAEQKAEQKPESDVDVDVDVDVERTPAAAAATAALPEQRPQPQPKPYPLPTGESSRRCASSPGRGGGGGRKGAVAVAGAGAATNARPERIQLTQMQLGQLQWQYQQALKENERALEEHRQRFNFLSAQSRALMQQQHYQQRSPATVVSHPSVPPQQQQQQQFQDPQADEHEATVRAATRALGGNMPGPAGGGGVRDVTGPPPAGHIPAAGLGEEGEAGRGNLVDPPRRAPDIAREARGWLKMMMQCVFITAIFGIDAEGWMVTLMTLGGFVTFLFRTGLLEEMLGSSQEGGGLWKKLCTMATVITEGGGLLMDVRFFCSAFFLSLFPKWQPVRSPEAIAAEAAAQARAREAAEAAAAAQAELRAQAQAAAEQAVSEARAAEASAAAAVARVARSAPVEVEEEAKLESDQRDQSDQSDDEGAGPTPTSIAEASSGADSDTRVADTAAVMGGTGTGDGVDTAAGADAHAANAVIPVEQGASNVDATSSPGEV